MKLRITALLLLALACKGGIYTGVGNDFPCDFSQPEGARDAVCAPGEVCGVDNVCRQYRYEGPQFDNGATIPNFSRAVVRHPLISTEPVSLVTRNVSDDFLNIFAITEQSNALALSLGRQLQSRTRPFPTSPSAVTAFAASNRPDAFGALLVRDGGDDLLFRVDDVSTLALRPTSLTEGDRLRPGSGRIALIRLPEDGGGFGGLELRSDGGVASLEATAADGGPLRIIDLRYLPDLPGRNNEVLALTTDGLYLNGRGRISPDGESMPALLTAQAPVVRTELRHDADGTLVAFTVPVAGQQRVLSTWRLDRVRAPSAERVWNDCAPCKGRIGAFTPVFISGAPTVEVLCVLGETLSLVRVIGSAAADEQQACIEEPIDAPFPLAQVNQVSRGRRAAESPAKLPVFDESFGAGVLLGGKRGQLWRGRSFSEALPVFLDRTPLAFGTLPWPDGGQFPAVLTDRYVAAARVTANGFEVLDLRNADFELPEGVVASAFIGQARGWGVLSSGDLLLLDPGLGDAGSSISFGPRLLDARGAPARSPYFGEAVSAADGGLISFVLTADDSIYFTPAPSATTPLSNQLEPLTPQLTPAPSSPIRSFTLERSAVGTDGVTRVRGYLVAGRSLFVVTLNGTPPRWTATPIVLQGGEPTEVWMDHPLGGLGRVGYRDGEVFTLPGGFLLVKELPREEGKNPPQVLDYENLGGWPVAMTSNGLFEAHYDVLEGGRLVNRFPDGGINRAMDWRRVTLPDGGEPWLGKTARLQVVQTYEPYDATTNAIPTQPPPAFVKVFRLLVYTDEQVLEVGTLVRR